MIKAPAIIHLAAAVAREHGLAYLLRKSILRIWNEVAHGEEHLFYFDRGDLSRETKDVPVTAEIEIEQFRKRNDIPPEYTNELKQLVKLKYMNEEVCQYYFEKLVDYFDDGGEITIGKLNGKIVGYVWKMHGKDNYHLYFHLLPLVPTDGFLIGGYVSPTHRGLGVFPTLLRYTGLQLKEEGADRIFGTCKNWNHPSRRGILKSGMRYLSTARSISIFGKKIVIWSHKKKIDNWT